MPAADRRLGELESVAGVDPSKPVQREVILPAAHDGIGQEARAGEAARDRQLRGSPIRIRRWRWSRSLRTNFGSDAPRRRRGRTALEDLARLHADPHVRSSPRARPRAGQLDRNAREIVGQELRPGTRRVCSPPALSVTASASARRRPRPASASIGRGRAGVVGRQALRLLTEQAASQPLIFLLECGTSFRYSSRSAVSFAFWAMTSASCVSIRRSRSSRLAVSLTPSTNDLLRSICQGFV